MNARFELQISASAEPHEPEACESTVLPRAQMPRWRPLTRGQLAEAAADASVDGAEVGEVLAALLLDGTLREADGCRRGPAEFVLGAVLRSAEHVTHKTPVLLRTSCRARRRRRR